MKYFCSAFIGLAIIQTIAIPVNAAPYHPQPNGHSTNFGGRLVGVGRELSRDVQGFLRKTFGSVAEFIPGLPSQRKPILPQYSHPSAPSGYIPSHTQGYHYASPGGYSHPGQQQYAHPHQEAAAYPSQPPQAQFPGPHSASLPGQFSGPASPAQANHPPHPGNMAYSHPPVPPQHFQPYPATYGQPHQPPQQIPKGSRRQ